MKPHEPHTAAPAAHWTPQFGQKPTATVLPSIEEAPTQARREPAKLGRNNTDDAETVSVDGRTRRRGSSMARGPAANSHPMVRRADGPGCCNIRGRVGL